MPKSADGLQYAGTASKTQGTIFPPQRLPRSFREKTEEEGIGAKTRQKVVKYNNGSWHLKAIETKPSQSPVFDPGGCSGRLCGCIFWEGGTRCIVGDLIWDALTVSRARIMCLGERRFEK